MAEVTKLKTSADYIEVKQCDLDFEEELRAAYAINGPVVSLIAEFREQCASMPTVVTGEQQEWQPIESAPREEFSSVILIARDGRGNGKRCVMPALFDGECWQSISLVGLLPFVNPTHWQPLPEPPAQPGDLESAASAYLAAETRFALRATGGDAVLVSVESLSALRRAYPNYYLDTYMFVEIVERALRGNIEPGPMATGATAPRR